jgi:hypothetical protein
MLIMSDTQRLRAGIASLNQCCAYCAKTLRAYPLIMGDDAAHSVYHAGCAVELATDILVDVSDFFCPPTPFDRVVVLTAPPPESD